MAQKTNRKGGATGAYTLRIPPAQLARIHELAVAEHRTLAGKLRVMIEAEIASHEPKIEAASSAAPR